MYDTKRSEGDQHHTIEHIIEAHITGEIER